MPQLTTAVSALLIVVGVGGYVLTDRVSLTALIPAAIGVVLILLALWARQPAARKHAMHGVMLICLIGIAGTVRGLMQLPTLLGGGGVPRPAAVYSQSITALVLLLLLVMGIRSFIAARRARAV
jgi:lysylphosphatidylglycerol synthetase-like protein (DUF2156 family)